MVNNLSEMKIKKLSVAKRFTAVFTAILLMFCVPLFACAKVPEVKSAQQLYEQVSPSVCTLRSVYSEGTGFVIKTMDDAFYILTNKHVFTSDSFTSQSAQADFLNGKSYEASLIGYNTYHDIAVLKVNAAPHEGLNALTFRSGDMANGQKLYSIGNALKLGLAMFEGMVSFNDRALELNTKRVPVMQITVPINGGSSGAPVFDENGQVAGVATYQIPEDDNQRLVDGMSFCISAKIAKSVYDQIMREYEKRGEAVDECPLLEVKLARVNTGTKTVIDIAALNFSGYLEDGVLIVASCSSIGSDAGVQLTVGDKISKIGSLDIKDAKLTDIFCELYKYADSGQDSDINEDAPLTILFTHSNIKKELTVLNKYEKNN